MVASKYSHQLKVLSEIHRDMSEIDSLCIVGSLTRDYAKEPNDIDLLALTRSELSDEEIVNYLMSGQLNDLGSANWCRSDQTVRGDIDGVAVGIAYINRDTLELDISGIFAGIGLAPGYRSWAVCGYTAPEVLCADVEDAILIIDKDGRLENLRTKLKTYPQQLRRSILNMSTSELANRRINAQRALKNDDLLMFSCVTSSSIFPLIRGLFAFNSIYFRGMKHLQPQLEKYLPDYIEGIHDLVCAGAGSEDRRLEIITEYEKMFKVQLGETTYE
jgi:predicted nucleotidyltransferase